jgi:hypothetical protein
MRYVYRNYTWKNIIQKKWKPNSSKQKENQEYFKEGNKKRRGGE